MIRASLIAAVLVAAPAAAHAGGYVSAGVGGAPSLGGELSTSLRADGERTGRVAIGHGFGFLSIEAGLGGFGVQGVAPDGAMVDGTALTGTISVAGHANLIAGLALYARLGLERTWVTNADTSLSGDGYLMGAGLEYGLPFVTVWAEADRELISLSQTMGTYDGHADSLLLGVRLGL